MELCVSIQGKPTSACPSSVAIGVIFQTQDGSASINNFKLISDCFLTLSQTEAGSDFVQVANQVTIPACVTEYCINVSLIDDSMVEQVEEFSVIMSNGLNPGLSDRIFFIRTEIVFTIIDTDCKFQLLMCNY